MTAPNFTNIGFGNMGPSAAAACTSQIEMTLSCRNLTNMDVMSKSDPFCIVFMKESHQDRYFEVGRTEPIDDNLSPEWVKKFILNYNFETIQKIRFEVWDKDPSGTDFIGEYESTMAEIVSYSGRQFVSKLKDKKSNIAGHIVIVTEEVSSCKEIIQMTFRATNLQKQFFFVRNDPFLVFSRSNEDGSYSVVLKTEVVSSTQNPRWKPLTIRGRTLCNGDNDRTIKIDCFDSRNDGDHKLIGTCQTSLRTLKKGAGRVGEDNQYLLRKTMNSKEHTGMLELMNIVVTEEISFLDYIRGGTQMHFAVAIDFTASNGSPGDPRSLHFMSNVPNSYEIALRSVGEIIQSYDTSQMYPAFGFGAKLPPTGNVSHQFPLNGKPSNPFCTSIQEILAHYRTTLTKVQLYGPTNFSPVILNTIEISKQYQDGKHYFVLLIITDGIISDMHPTIRAIINASKLPISIIIVGVGSADFGAMDELDADDKRLNLDGQFADRDIVQFVPLNRFLVETGSFVKSQADLARAVLAEIPDQMVGYMKSKGFKPQPTAGPTGVPSAPIS
ncbi:copine-8-like [Bradysia coprophila]|uniref:copine-8-like n=1 Tax=Bradysia coprophila TaxID=38358 RepID=UPI00187DB7AD|nr:copine-8-like [Bradysia coprophila]